MVVVGGRDSGNTRRLFTETALMSGVPSFQIEDETELDPSDFARFKTVGLTASAPPRPTG